MSGPIEITENLEDLYENAPCGYLSFLNDGLIVKVNQTLLTWLGRERSELTSGLRFQDLIPVGEQIFFETQLSPLLQMQGRVEEVQLNLLTHDKTKIPVLTSTKQARMSDGKTIVNRMTIFNIADRKKFESELMHARKKAEALAKSKADFLSMLSHEIRTPLNAIIGVSNLLDSTALSPEQAPFMEMLKNSSDNLMNLLNSILDLSKIESGKISLEKKEFRLKEFIEGNMIAWQGLARKSGIELITNVDPKIPPSAVGDPIKITQILSNLIGNAVKFTKVGHVRLSVRLVSLEASQMTVRFQVQDTGIGIAASKLASIFEEFTQADTETVVKFGGTGLGLAISQALAALYGSRIEVQSVVGEGSTFGFTLPLPIGNPSVDTHGIERVANQTDALMGLRVLVADDSADNLMLMSHLFKKWGAVLSSAKNGAEAVEMIKANTYDVVLMDVRMPVMSGYEAAVLVRTLPLKRDIPIIAFSGSTTFEGHDLSNSKVFNAVIGKPFKTTELIATLLPFSKA